VVDGVKWESGPLYLSAQYERTRISSAARLTWRVDARHLVTDASGNKVPAPDAHSKDTAMRFSGGVQVWKPRVAGDIARLKYEESGQAAGNKFVSYEHTNWAISFESSWGGPWRTAIEYVSGGEGTCKLTILDLQHDRLEGCADRRRSRIRSRQADVLYALAAQLKTIRRRFTATGQRRRPARGADITQIALAWRTGSRCP